MPYLSVLGPLLPMIPKEKQNNGYFNLQKGLICFLFFLFLHLFFFSKFCIIH